jgi:hypothetical protein
VPIGDDGFRITDPAQVAEAIRVEYKALRDQIAEADRTCVVLQGALITATIALVSLGSERDQPGFAWLVGPLWIIGHCYLAEKRAIIVHTARYLLTEIEPRHAGLEWETWHHRQTAPGGVPQPVRFYPLYLETLIGSTVVLGDVLLVGYLQDGLLDAPWFALACVVAVGFAALVTRSLVKYKQFEDYLAQL